MTTGGAPSIETSTIYQIPLDQRHGRARDLFTVWFGANLSILTICDRRPWADDLQAGFLQRGYCRSCSET